MTIVQSKDLQFFGATRKLGVINEQSPISLGKVQVCGPNFRPLDRPMGCPIRLAIVNHNEYFFGVLGIEGYMQKLQEFIVKIFRHFKR